LNAFKADSATVLCTQQSIKAYADSVGGGGTTGQQYALMMGC